MCNAVQTPKPEVAEDIEETGVQVVACCEVSINFMESRQRFFSANFWPKRCAASPKVTSIPFQTELLNAVTEGDFKKDRYAESSLSLNEL